MKRTLFSLFSVFTLVANAQLTVTPIATPTDMVNYLQGFGLTISNMTMTGDSVGFGFFSGTSNMAFGNGVVLTTGSAFDIPNPQFFFANGTHGNMAGDADLSVLSGNTTYDASVIEFDCIPVHSNIQFDFSFGSEEYSGFYCSNYNDVFAILVSGTDTSGNSYTNKNIAVIPGTNIPVCVNNVYDTASHLTVAPACPSNNPNLFINNANDTIVAYDGFTTGLTALLPVVAGSSYHFKIAIADASDQSYDSGVMFLANSFRSMATTTAITKHEAQPKLSVYPNPAHDKIQVSTKAIVKKIEIYNSVGSNVKTETVNADKVIDISSFEKGIYFLRATTSSGSVTQTFIKE